MSAPAPLAAGDEFAAAVDALAEVASYANLAHVIAPNDDRAPSEWAAARANVLRLYAAAEARGRAAALAEVDAACDELEAALDAVIDQLGDLLDRNDYRTVVALDAQADELAARLARLATTNTTGNAR